jgi:hypothetical protein
LTAIFCESRVLIMIFARLGVLITTVAVLLCIATVSPSSAAEFARIEARFEIFGIAGLHLLTNRTTVQQHGDHYAITTDLDTRGLASVFIDLTSHSEVHGRLARDTAVPDAYRANVRRNGEERRYSVDYHSDGAVTNVSTSASSAPSPLARTEQIRGAVDQLTAYFLLEHQLAQRGTCATVVPVFDGSGLYNLHFSDIKRETLSANGYQNFAGLTQVCEVTREEISASRGKDEDTYRRGRIWYAPLMGGDRLLPVRMEFDTKFGAVTGYLAELRGRDVDLRLMGD